MAGLEPYTSTYTDTDGSIFDGDDLVNEFWRVAYFLELWGGSIDAVGKEVTYETHLETISGELAEVFPSNGLIQSLKIEANVQTFEVKINPHTTGDPYRLYIVIRCLSKDTRFSISVPSGQSHIFGVNRTEYMPSQVIGDGYHTATLIVTYSQNTGVLVQVNAGNTEETVVDYDDIQQLVTY